MIVGPSDAADLGGRVIGERRRLIVSRASHILGLGGQARDRIIVVCRHRAIAEPARQLNALSP